MIELRAKVGSRGQVVIPKPIRDMFHIHANENVTFSVDHNDILVRKENGKEVLERMLSRFPKKKAPVHVDWDEIYYSQFED